MMYSVVRTGGQQYKVSAGDTITIKRLDAEVGSEIALGDVLLVAGGSSDPQIGAPVVDGAVVKAQVVSHQKGDKRETFKYIPRHRSRVRRGFRPSETTVTITAVEA
jgi:large subunit ribosomal protein L21